MAEGADKPEAQWTQIRGGWSIKTNTLKALVYHVYQIMKLVISCETAKSTWTELDEKEVLHDKEETQVKVVMALADDELFMGRNHACNGKWIDITMKKVRAGALVESFQSSESSIENTLAEYIILSGADNRPPMLDKDLHDSWKSRMEIYMQNREHGRMIPELVENGPLIWSTIEENGVTRTKKYAELSAAEKNQADCDVKATNIILQGLLADIYSLVNHHRVAKDL
nr:hypothetical protein [Tanacetum cinerariifolium]